MPSKYGIRLFTGEVKVRKEDANRVDKTANEARKEYEMKGTYEPVKRGYRLPKYDRDGMPVVKDTTAEQINQLKKEVAALRMEVRNLKKELKSKNRREKRT
jgi:hypothetical protein